MIYGVFCTLLNSVFYLCVLDPEENINETKLWSMPG